MATDSIKLYGLIYVALMALAALSVGFERTLSYWNAVGAILIISTIKTLLIVGYFQHLKYENRSLTGLMAVSLGLVLLLMAAAAFSIT